MIVEKFKFPKINTKSRILLFQGQWSKDWFYRLKIYIKVVEILRLSEISRLSVVSINVN